MDAASFDRLSRVLASGITRRQLAAAIGIAAPWALPRHRAAAKHCPPCRQKKHGRCTKHRPNGTPCGEPCLECRKGRCVSACVPPATNCGERTPGVCCIPDGGPCAVAHPEQCCSTSCQTFADGPKCSD
jgi:hypothetical protein